MDLGGTSVRAAVVDATGALVSETFSAPSKAEEGAEATLEAIVSACCQARSACDGVSAVGIAIPGHVDDEAGLVRWSPNFGVKRHGVLDYWKDVDLRRPLEQALTLPVRMANDANAAAIGEYRYGSGGGNARCLVLLTLGTGIGGGVVLGRESVGGQATGALLLLGGNKGGAELGHTVIARGGLDSSSGAHGTVEAYCQRDAIVRRAQNKLVRGRKSLMSDHKGALTPETISNAAKMGDAVALEVWREVGEYLGTAVGSLINVFAPNVFALGGQVALAGDPLLLPTIAEAERVAIPSLFRDCKITLAERTTDAGLVGAAVLALESQAP